MFLMLAFLLAGGTVSVAAGEQEADEVGEAAKTRRIELFERVKEAILLPQTANESRDSGAREEKVREVLETARTRGVPADETRRILVIENEELKHGGNPDNFGAAVHSLKASGLRGRELAKAIHAEQIARGMKKPKSKERGKAMAKHRKDKAMAKHKGANESMEIQAPEAEKKQEAEGAAKTRRKG
jgi:hypothetical protein